MNLHTFVSGAIGAVNKFIPLDIRVSTGSVQDSSYKSVPQYATPGALVGAIAGNVLSVSVVSAGKLLSGQGVAGAGVLANTVITAQLSGVTGGIGTYSVNRTQTVGEEALTTSVIRPGQVQPITWRDLQQLDGLNLQGTRAKIYVYGQVEGLVRTTERGGDLIILPDGKTWLTAQVLEGWHTAGWCSIAATLQDDPQT